VGLGLRGRRWVGLGICKLDPLDFVFCSEDHLGNGAMIIKKALPLGFKSSTNSYKCNSNCSFQSQFQVEILTISLER